MAILQRLSTGGMQPFFGVLDYRLFSLPVHTRTLLSARYCQNKSRGAIAPKVTATSTSSTMELLDIEAQQPMPRSHAYSMLRYIILNTYRRLFTLVFVANIIAFGVVITKEPSLSNVITASAVNFLVCGLARQPLVVNMMFKYCCKMPRSAPLRLRMWATKVFHYGGVHSGAGVASLLWYVGAVALLTDDYLNNLSRGAAELAAIVVAYLILFLLLSIVIVSMPSIRRRLHNQFELIHRFAGWASILLFWVLLLVISSTKPPMRSFLVREPGFWVLIAITAAVITPWLTLRRVAVTAEPLSTHAIRLHFEHTTLDFGQGLSVARHPFRDWHSFAGVPDKFDDTYGTNFSLLVSKAGDWTSNCISSPPTHLWKRAVPSYGFGYVMQNFSSMILVTTGSGIGPSLSFLALAEHMRPRMRIIWQTKTPEITYGARVLALVRQLDPNVVIIDTSKAGGRVDMLPKVLELRDKEGAEAVGVISNPRLTGKLVFELERWGVPAYGPIFDS